MHRPTVRQERLPASDEIVEVAPGVLRLQLDINFPGLGHVNCYAMEDRARASRWSTRACRASTPWRQFTKRMEQAGLPVKRVHTVVVTHSHPDHFGAADRIRHDERRRDRHREELQDASGTPTRRTTSTRSWPTAADLDAWAAARERLVKFWRSSRRGGPTSAGTSRRRGAARTPARPAAIRSATGPRACWRSRYIQPPKPSRRVVDGEDPAHRRHASGWPSTRRATPSTTSACSTRSPAR